MHPALQPVMAPFFRNPHMRLIISSSLILVTAACNASIAGSGDKDEA